ncbi:hypothetical protein Vafri_21000 [Volvox africanus]|uniref:Uncharacterized protein n=1 Tax=Volvox africanus TaxID=51714 RepID=A0A8J4FAY2_9CHLO|nr:hypothetical protein Vafri_21000 [Volvox africanus]
MPSLQAQVPSPSRSKAPADSADGAPATLTSTGAGAPTPGTPASAAASAAAVPVLRRGVSASSSHFSAGGSGLPVMDEHSRAIRKMQTEVAAIREDYARRLVEMDDVVASCESNMRDGIQGLERMFNVLVSRTAGILAGRLGYFKGIMPGAKVSARPGTPVVAAGGGGRPSTAAAAAAAAASTAVLHMNERLAAENAQLLAELSRWQSGRHAMLRKLNMVVLGTDPLPPAAPPLTHQQKIAQALAAVTGQQPSPPSPPQATAPLTPSAPRIFQYQQNFTGTPPPANTAATAAADTAMTAAREALAAATRDALLAGRKELLPAVMTAEGWGGAAVQGGWDTTATTQQLHGGKVESSVAAAESSLRLRTQLLALQAEVTRSRATGGEVVEKGREREVLEEDHAIALADVRRELAAAKQQISHMQRELERARAGINTDGGRPHAQDTVERERLEDALAAARDDAVRHKQVASAAKRDLEAKERAMEEAQLRYERLEAQCRDARSEAQRQGEGVKRLRLLLAQAKSLLKEQGVSFMEDDPGLDLLLTAGPQGQGGGGGGAKTGKAQRPAGSGTDADGPLFKALDAREREKEMQRLQSEVADLSAQLTAANKELKRTRKAAAAAAEAGAAAEREQRLQLASTIEALANEAEAAKDAARASQKQLQDSKHEGGDLRRQIAELNDKLTRAKLDGEYLRARAAAGKMKPKLTHARALSLSISPAAAAPSSEG